MSASTLTRRQTMFCLRVDTVTAQCSVALTDAGVPHLLLKGPTIARWLYGEGLLRPYGDTDLLVPAPDLARAARVLEGLGFRDPLAGLRPDEGSRHAVNYHRAGAAVDLHHTLSLAPERAPVWEVFARGAGTMVIAGAAVPVPGVGARCVFLALHAVQHGRRRAKPLEDLRRGLAQVPAAHWEHADRLAAELGVLPAYRLGRALVERPELTPSDPVWTDAPLQVRLRAGGAVPGALALAYVQDLRGAARVRFVLRRAFPSAGYLRRQYPTRRGVAAAYAGHLVVVARRVAPALSAVRLHRR